MSTAVYLPGPAVCGLHGMFEENFGDPATSIPYCRVTPSRIGSSLLPFHCPRCKTAIDFSDAAKRECYHDTRDLDRGAKRDNYWCPNCGLRFLLNLKGRTFDGDLDDGVASSVVECVTVGHDGMVDLKRSVQGVTTIVGRLLGQYIIGTDVLGCC